VEGLIDDKYWVENQQMRDTGNTLTGGKPPNSTPIIQQKPNQHHVNQSCSSKYVDCAPHESLCLSLLVGVHVVVEHTQKNAGKPNDNLCENPVYNEGYVQ
jgi:hypothetical protein